MLGNCDFHLQENFYFLLQNLKLMLPRFLLNKGCRMKDFGTLS